MSVYEEALSAARDEMVARFIARRGIRDTAVLEAMRTVPRHLFVPPEQVPFALEDRPLLIGSGQTISQPFIVALMTEALELQGHERVLEIGTGSGYQTAVLAEIVARVYSVEIVDDLSLRAERTLTELGYTNFQTRFGDGYEGWPEEAPFDAIIVTAAPPSIPSQLEDQLAEGGRMVLPVGSGFQELMLVRKASKGTRSERLAAVAFVPMTRGLRKR